MDRNFMIFYRYIDGVYEPYQYGENIVPTKNMDKVLQVPEEVAAQAHKFHFDGKKLKRKEGEYILTLEQLKEKQKQDEISAWEGTPPHTLKEEGAVQIEF